MIEREGVVRFLERFRKNIVSSALKNKNKKPKKSDIDYKIALGVLLWGIGAVAEADNKFLPEEDKKIKEILLTYTKIPKEDFPIVLTAIKQAAMGHVKFDKFARDVSKKLPYNTRISLLEDLFRIGWADKNLDSTEFDVIKKAANAFAIAPSDFVNSEMKIKKEFGL